MTLSFAQEGRGSIEVRGDGVQVGMLMRESEGWIFASSDRRFRDVDDPGLYPLELRRMLRDRARKIKAALRLGGTHRGVRFTVRQQDRRWQWTVLGPHKTRGIARSEGEARRYARRYIDRATGGAC